MLQGDDKDAAKSGEDKKADVKQEDGGKSADKAAADKGKEEGGIAAAAAAALGAAAVKVSRGVQLMFYMSIYLFFLNLSIYVSILFLPFIQKIHFTKKLHFCDFFNFFSSIS